MAEVMAELYDGPHATPAPADDGPVYLGIKNITDTGLLDLSDVRHIAEEDFDHWTRRVLPQAGDVVFTYEATLHRYALIPEGFRGCLGRRIALIRPDRTVVRPRFLHFLMLGPKWRATVTERIISGSTVDRIPLMTFDEFPIAVPDLSAQDAVVEVLGAIDDLIENNGRRVEVLEEMARAIYREWFVHFRFPGHEHATFADSDLGPIPEGWRVSTCGRELRFVGGGTPSKKESSYWDPATVDWFTPSDLTKSKPRYPRGSSLQISKLGLARSSATLFPAGTVMMTSRATLGVLAIATQAATTNQGFISVLPDNRWPPNFIREYLDASAEELAALGTGATFKEITKGSFKTFRFVVPAQSVLDQFRAATEAAEQSTKCLEQSGEQLAVMRDLLLPRLVTGQIDVSHLDLDAVVERAGA